MSFLTEEELIEIFDNPNFKSDKCSGGITLIWERFSKKPCDYNYYCVKHDCGWWKILKDNKDIIESNKEKISADIELISDIWNHNKNWYDKPMAMIVAVGLETGGFFYFNYKYLKK